MFIDTIYQNLYKHHFCSNAYDFSERFLGKSKCYYSVLKTRQDEPSIETIAILETALKNTSSVYNRGTFSVFAPKHQMLAKMANDVARYREQRTNQVLSNKLVSSIAS